MIVRCTVCGSAVTQALLDINQCLACGALLEQDGTVRPSRGESELVAVLPPPVLDLTAGKAGSR